MTSKVGADLVEAFKEMAAHLRGETEAEGYELPPRISRTLARKSDASRATRYKVGNKGAA